MATTTNKTTAGNKTFDYDSYNSQEVLDFEKELSALENDLNLESTESQASRPAPRERSPFRQGGKREMWRVGGETEYGCWEEGPGEESWPQTQHQRPYISGGDSLAASVQRQTDQRLFSKSTQGKNISSVRRKAMETFGGNNLRVEDGQPCRYTYAEHLTAALGRSTRENEYYFIRKSSNTLNRTNPPQILANPYFEQYEQYQDYGGDEMSDERFSNSEYSPEESNYNYALEGNLKNNPSEVYQRFSRTKYNQDKTNREGKKKNKIYYEVLKKLDETVDDLKTAGLDEKLIDNHDSLQSLDHIQRLNEEGKLGNYPPHEGAVMEDSGGRAYSQTDSRDLPYHTQISKQSRMFSDSQITSTPHNSARFYRKPRTVNESRFLQLANNYSEMDHKATGCARGSGNKANRRLRYEDYEKSNQPQEESNYAN